MSTLMCTPTSLIPFFYCCSWAHKLPQHRFSPFLWFHCLFDHPPVHVITSEYVGETAVHVPLLQLLSMWVQVACDSGQEQQNETQSRGWGWSTSHSCLFQGMAVWMSFGTFVHSPVVLKKPEEQWGESKSKGWGWSEDSYPHFVTKIATFCA